MKTIITKPFSEETLAFGNGLEARREGRNRVPPAGMRTGTRAAWLRGWDKGDREVGERMSGQGMEGMTVTKPGK